MSCLWEERSQAAVVWECVNSTSHQPAVHPGNWATACKSSSNKRLAVTHHPYSCSQRLRLLFLQKCEQINLHCLLGFTMYLAFLPSMARQSHGPPHWGFVSHSNTSHSVGLRWTSDQPVAETSTWQHIHSHKTSVTPAGFEQTIPRSERLQTHALDHAAAGIGPYIQLAGVNNTSCHFEIINCYVVPNCSSSWTLVVYGFTRHIRNCKIGS
jgi:hypothetical protein